MNYKIKCDNEQLEAVQIVAFDNGLTWPGGSQNITKLMGNEHYIFMDKEYIWSESKDAFYLKENYQEINVEDYVKFEGEPYSENEVYEEPVEPVTDLIELDKVNLVTLLINGEYLLREDQSAYCYFDIDNSEPFRSVRVYDKSESRMDRYDWETRLWRKYDVPTQMTLKEIEEALGYRIEIVDK